MLEVPGLGDRPPRMLCRQTLADVIEPRIEEIYSLVQPVLRESGFEELLSSGVVITGGTALMQGMTELGEDMFHMPVRVGVPAYAGGLPTWCRSPRYADRGRAAFRRPRPIPRASCSACPDQRARRASRNDEAVVQVELLNRC